MFPRAVKRVYVAFLSALLGPASLATPQIGERPPLRRDAFVQDGGTLGIGRLVQDIALQDTFARTRTLSEVLRSKGAVVIVMTSTTCPVSKRYAPRVAAMEDEYKAKGVAFVYVNTVRSETPDEMRRQVKDMGFDGLYLPDRAGAVAGALAARTTTEVFVLDAARTLVYRGAVDDQVRVGGTAAAAEHHYLRDAINATLAGKKVEVPATWAPGCLLDAPARIPEPAGGVTYYNRVARILADNCNACHRSDGPAPFALDHYGAVIARAAMIEAVVRDDLMPPTHGLHFGRNGPVQHQWRNDRTLTDADKRDLLAWLRSTRPMGDVGDKPIQREPSQTWEIGLPDAIYSTPEMAVPAEGAMRHERIILPLEGDATRWITEIECRPMMRDTVHHALVWVVPEGVEPGKDIIPTGGELLATYSPGDGVVKHAPGTARRVGARSRLVVDLFATPMGRDMRASLRVALRLGQGEMTAVQSTFIRGQDGLRPAGAQGVCNSSVTFLDSPVLVTAITPVFGPRCTAVDVWAELPDKTRLPLLTTGRYDFRWRIRYEPEDPILLPVGTVVVARAAINTGVLNAANPDVDEAVKIGSREAEEPCFTVLDWIDGTPKP